MLSSQHRHPHDLREVSFEFTDYKREEEHYISMLVKGEHQKQKKCVFRQSLITIHMAPGMLDTGVVRMPVWMAKNKELMINNEFIPVEVPFP